jgi:hypothetical protein
MRITIGGVIALACLGFGCVAGDGDGDDGPPPPPDDPSGDLDPFPTDTFPPDPTPDLLRVFSGCPEQTDLAVNEFAARWSSLGSAEGNCQLCHSSASSGYEAIQNDTGIALAQMTTSEARMRVFFAKTTTDVVVNDNLQDVAEGVPPHAEHPRYDLVGTGAFDALTGVHALAHARFTAGTCGPPRY